MENNRKKILKFTIIGLLFFIIILTTNESYAAKLQEGNITLPKSSYEYTGKIIHPVPKVKYYSKILTKNKDYTLSYSNIKDAGTASVIIRGRGQYTGEVVKKFTITPKKLSNCIVLLSNSTFTYDGTEQKPQVIRVMTREEGKLVTVDSSNYTVSYKNNINAGTASVVITGKRNYTGTINKNFTINKKRIETALVTLSNSTFTYDGTEKRPQIKNIIIRNAGILVPIDSSNYTVNYANNINAGTAYIGITGKGNYSGSKTLSFRISKRGVQMANVELTDSTFTYDGSEKKPGVKKVEIKSETGKILSLNSNNFTISYKNNINAGRASVVITGIGNYAGTINKNFTINKRNMQTADVELENSTFKFDALEKTPQIKSVKIKNDAGKIVSLNTSDFKVSYKNNINAGTASAIITGSNLIDSNFVGSKTINFTIEKALITDCTITVNYISNGEPEIDIRINDVKLGDENYSLGYYSKKMAIGSKTEEGIIITGKGNLEGSVEKPFVSTPVVKEESGSGYTKVVAVGDREYKIYNQGLYGGSIASSGCSIACEAMVLSAYGKDLTPPEIAKSETVRKNGGIRYTRMLNQIADDLTDFGIDSTASQKFCGHLDKDIRDKAVEDITNNLKQGKPVIILVRGVKGDLKYTADAHYITLLGFNSDGTVCIGDPNGYGNPKKGEVREDTVENLVENYIYSPTGAEQGYVLINQ